ncbi:MAG: M48 family metallopeptidase [Deltaproteobacteria bacterium]|jgi:Zn-dependent protease with chaperone function|nr:M48 family metallopeptidase [Deltaproteobacteria bacterium]
MDFFASQDVARRKTSLLLLYFTLAVFLIIVAIYLAVTFIFLYQSGTGELGLNWLWNPELFGAVAGATLIIVGSGSLYKISVLRSGGARVAEMLGGRLIPASSINFLEKRLLNIVEEMAIASGVPVPPVYLLEGEEGINAFAAGFTQDDAVIGITRGAIETLNREELQGVVAHEFSHILNGDMWLDLKLVGFLHGILLIALIGRSILRGSSRSRNSKNSGGAVLLGLALLILGYIGILFGRLIKSSVARQREYLADASAVQFTRNPFGLAGALKKIGAMTSGSLIKHSKAEEISHMFFSNGLKGTLLGLFATHPPLVDRIVRLDPAFDGTFPKIIPKQVIDEDNGGISSKEKEPAGKTTEGAAAVMTLAVLAAAPGNITGEIGAPVREHMDNARRLLDSLPGQIRAAASEPFGARAVIYGLLLDRNREVRELQMLYLKNSADPQAYEETERIVGEMLGLAEETRLPLMDLAMASLRSMSLQQFRKFEKNINSLVRIDNRISLFEFILESVVIRRLEKSFIMPQGSVREIGIQAAAEEISCILSLLVNIGHEGNGAAQAFTAATAALDQHGKRLRYLTKEECSKINLPDTLKRLAQLSPKMKRSFISACFQGLVHDKRITMKEAEFFRLLVYALDVPLPPWVKI